MCYTFIFAVITHDNLPFPSLYLLKTHLYADIKGSNIKAHKKTSVYKIPAMIVHCKLMVTVCNT